MNERLVELMSQNIGWTPINQVVAILQLIEKRRSRYIVDINVFGGRSFLPLAFAAKKINGIAVAIDSFTLTESSEQLFKDYAHLDFNVLKARLQNKVNAYGLKKHVKFIFKDPDFVSMKLPKDIDLLHLSTHSGRFAALTNLRKYNRKVKKNGLLWLEEFSPAEFEPIFRETKTTFRILQKFDETNHVLERT